MSLILHAGAEPVEYGALALLPTPEATASHVPIPHGRLVDIVKHMLSFYGHEVMEEHHGVTKDGARYFGVLTLKSLYGDYTDMVGLRNSHDKSMPIGLAFGSRVFVCDNLAFVADAVVKRKHTIKAKHELPGLISELVEPLADTRLAQHKKLVSYQQKEITDVVAEHAVMQMYRKEVINLQRIPEVLNQWDNPDHDWGKKSVWRLFNACTHALNGRIAEDPTPTRILHSICDQVVEMA
jgi:hypothetical protein